MKVKKRTNESDVTPLAESLKCLSSGRKCEISVKDNNRYWQARNEIVTSFLARGPQMEALKLSVWFRGSYFFVRKQEDSSR